MANYEQLFLLEVLVDRVKLLTKALSAFSPQDEEEPDTPVRIRVKFSDFPCFEITQDLAPPEKDKRESDVMSKAIMFSSGKSCMFPMDPEQLVQDLIKYPMAVTVFKKNPQCTLPDIIGQTKVPLGDFMTNTIKKAAEWSLEEPISEMLSDTFPLRNAQDQDVGTINMLIRLTCFGKTIITKFQIADNKKSFLFKNSKTQDYEFQCKKCMPGQPISRPQPQIPDEDAWEEEGMIGDNEPNTLDKELMTEYYPDKPLGHKESHTNGHGYHKHEMQGPGFTASMEVRYPDGNRESEEISGPCVMSGPTETHSAPTVKNGKEKGKDKTRGKSLEPKKIEIQNGVPLEQPKRRRRSKFYVQPGISYPGVILGHRYCVNQGPPVPAKNGWAWRTSVPLGMKRRSKDWEPGDIPPEILELIELSREKRGLPPPKVNAKTRRRKSSELVPMPDKIESRPPTLHVHRHKGSYHITMYPVVQPGDEYKDIKQPLKFTINRPEDDSEYDSESDLEFEFNVPEPDTAIQMVNHQTQYNSKDCPPPPPPPPTPPPKSRGKSDTSDKKKKKK